MTYSSDFRRKVLSVREQEGLTISEVAARFCVGVASVVRWLKHPEPKRMRNKPATKIDMQALARDVKDFPDAYQYERAQRLGCSAQGIAHALRRLKVTYKKTLTHPKACGAARRIFQVLVALYKHQGRTIVYIDESGFAHDMPRTHGYARRGDGCHGTQDWHVRGRTNAIGALIGKHLLTVGLFAANITADIFTAWVGQDLLPKLPEKSVIVMDNATFHKRADTQDLIRTAGHTLIFQPAYSPKP